MLFSTLYPTLNYVIIRTLLSFELSLLFSLHSNINYHKHTLAHKKQFIVIICIPRHCDQGSNSVLCIISRWVIILLLYYIKESCSLVYIKCHVLFFESVGHMRLHSLLMLCSWNKKSIRNLVLLHEHYSIHIFCYSSKKHRNTITLSSIKNCHISINSALNCELFLILKLYYSAYALLWSMNNDVQ